MHYNKVHLIYFSPTHTSAKTVFAIADGLAPMALMETDITYDVPQSMLELQEDELAVVAVPVYGGRVAETAVERLKAVKAFGTPVVPVVVYGNRDYEDALLELSDLLTEQGFIPVASGAFIGEHSYSRKGMPIAEGRPDKDDLANATRFGSAVQQKLEAVESLSQLPELKMKGNRPYRVKGPSTPMAPVVNEELCSVCGYCIDICPVDAISMADGKIVSDPELCIKCCACVKDCPEGARIFDTPYTPYLHQNFSARRDPEWFL